VVSVYTFHIQNPILVIAITEYLSIITLITGKMV
jgi:hypothetical protein